MQSSASIDGGRAAGEKAYRRRMSAIMSANANRSSGESIMRLSKSSKTCSHDKMHLREDGREPSRMTKTENGKRKTENGAKYSVRPRGPGFRFPIVDPFSQHVTSPTSMKNTQPKHSNYSNLVTLRVRQCIWVKAMKTLVRDYSRALFSWDL